jgi:hypothetical protein
VEYVLGVIGPGTGEAKADFTARWPLSEDEHAQTLDACRSLNKYLLRSSFDLVKHNYQMYFQMHDAYAKSMRDVMRGNREPGQEVYFNLTSQVLNYLFNVRLFLDHTRTDLARRYGKESTELENLQQSTARAFDESFAYRFFYHLRNFCQHCGMPIGHVQLRAALVGFPEREETSLEVAFDTDSLLRDYQDWHSKVRADLRDAPKLLSVNPLLVEAQEQLEDVRKSVVVADMPMLDAAAHRLEQIVLRLEGVDGQPNIFSMEPDGSGHIRGFSMQALPMDRVALLRQVQRQLQWKPEEG